LVVEPVECQDSCCQLRSKEVEDTCHKQKQSSCPCHR
jgi:hypothetical protein